MKIDSSKPGKLPKADGLSSIASRKDAATIPDTASPLTGDVLSIAGIPEAELTPKVRDALTSLMTEITSLRQQVSTLKAQVHQTEELAYLDPLLNIFNRRAFVRDLDKTMSIVQRYGIRASLAFIDLNGLKQVNDTYGHSAGDKALCHVASIIKDNIRSGDSFGRIGGDEFGLTLMNASVEMATQKLDQLTEEISKTTVTGATPPFKTGIAYGIVALTNKTRLEDALEMADSQMYTNKMRSG